MRAKVFLVIIICITFSFPFFAEVRELSIQQLEERKKADEERKKQREKRAKKNSKKKLYLRLISFLFQRKENYHRSYQI